MPWRLSSEIIFPFFDPACDGTDKVAQQLELFPAQRLYYAYVHRFRSSSDIKITHIQISLKQRDA
jgi:hypothetical protein